VDDLQDFQGIWQAVWLAEKGRKMTAEEVKETSLTITGNRYTFHLADYTFHGTISRIASTHNCGAVDFVAEGPSSIGKTLLGIYLLEDDELTVCVAPPERERPTSFSPQRGSGHSLYLLRKYVPSWVRPVEEAVS